MQRQYASTLMVDCCLYVLFRWDGQSSLLISLYSHCVVFWKGVDRSSPFDCYVESVLSCWRLTTAQFLLEIQSSFGLSPWSKLIPRRFFTCRVIESQQHCQCRAYGHWIWRISTRKVVERRAAAMDSWHYLYGWCSGGGGSAVMVEAFFHLMRRWRKNNRGKIVVI